MCLSWLWYMPVLELNPVSCYCYVISLYKLLLLVTDMHSSRMQKLATVAVLMAGTFPQNAPRHARTMSPVKEVCLMLCSARDGWVRCISHS
jgi:hypothetical protein